MHFPRWRLLSDPPQSPQRNMAVDEAVATAFWQGTVPPTLRFYRWAAPALSIGKFQSPPSSWSDALNAQAIPLVRRVTGGRGILHGQQDGEITYSLIADSRATPFSGGIRQTFHAISAGFIAGLNMLDIDAQMYVPPATSSFSSHPQKRHPLCFSTVSRDEVTAQGKKLLGSAQRRWPSYFLQQGCMALERNAHHPNDQIALRDLGGPGLTWQAVEAALVRGMETALSIRLELCTLTSKEQRMADRLAAEKYLHDDWNLYHRLPSCIRTDPLAVYYA